jgi:excinuclease ABC subunit C
MKNWRDKIEKIPNSPGIYLFYNKGVLMYIGKATSLQKRIKSYLKPKTARPIELLIETIDEVQWKVVDSVIEALILEANYIKKLKPKYNIKEKDDKSWNFLVITKEDFPKLKAVRENNLNVKDYKYIFGPYAGIKVSQILKILHNLFYVSRCEANQKKPCFDYQLKRCLGVCTNEIDSKAYNKKVIKPLVSFLKGNKKTVINILEKEMKKHSKEKDFEEALRIRNQIFSLKKIVDFSLLDKSFIEDQSKQTKRIEAYDISNLGDEVMVGGMVALENNSFVDYKKFKIKKVKAQSDTDCLKEVIERRFNHSEWQFPDLLLIDGGRSQINAVKKALKYDIPILGIAKGKKRDKDELIYSVMGDWIEKNKGVLLKLRDEVHRFSINYQRETKRKKFLN